MNFYNEEENDKKAGGPALPRAASPFKKTSAFGKTPLFSRAAGGIMDRLKNLSRRDMALVGLGLSVLTMVPTAEYMMSQPQQENLLSGGFGGPAPQGGASPYEPGINGLSQGSSDGSGEVITPLASRDPVSLILGSQPAQPAVSAPVYTPPQSSMRDAMKDAGREAFSAASRSAGAPTVIPRMAASMRSMSFFGGGESSRTQGSLGGGKIIDDARAASSKSAKRSMVGPVAMAGYKGVATTPNSASKGAFEKLRSAADKSAGNFNGDSAIRSLDKAAADAVDLKGAGGMGAGGDSDKTGKTSNNSVKGYDHNRSGETLEEMMAKKRMEKALEWEFYKKYEIKKQIMTAIVGAVSGVIGDFIKGNLTTALGMDPPRPAKCYTHVRENPDWPAAEKAVLAGTVKSTLEYICKADGGPTVISYQVGDKAAVSQSKKCICDAFAGSTGGAVTPPGTATGTGQNPVVPGATPQQISANTAQNISDYDSVLRDKLFPAIKDYHKVAKKSVDENMQPKAVNKEDEEKVTKALNSAVTELNTAAANSVANALKAKNREARGAFNEYGTAVGKLIDTVESSQANKDINNITKLEALAKAGAGAGKKCSVKMNPSFKPEGVAAVENQSNCQMIVDAIAKSEDFKSAKGNFKSASDALQAHRNRKAAFSSQLVEMDNGVTSIVQKHAAIPGKVKEILDPEGNMLDKIDRIIAKSADIPAEPEAAPGAKSMEAKKPLLIAIEDLRAITLASFWDKKFDSSKAVQVEQTAWGPFDTEAAKGAASLTAPANFEASFQRPNEMMTSIAGAAKGLSDIETMVKTAGTNSADAIKELRKLADECNFTDGGCTAAAAVTSGNDKPEKPVETPQVPAVVAQVPTAANNPHNLDSDQLKQVQKDADIIAECNAKTGGFTGGAENCDIAEAARVRGTLNQLNTYMSASSVVMTYDTDVRSACGWVNKCRTADLPASCSSYVTRVKPKKK